MSTLALDRHDLRGRYSRARKWLDEPPGELFNKGKWVFWMPALFILSLLNTILTVQTFGATGRLYWLIGMLLLWMGIGALHYSDVPSRGLAVLISLLDGLILVSLAVSFCLLFYIQGQADILRGDEEKFAQTQQQNNATALQALAEARRIAEANARAEQARSSSISSYQEQGQMISAARLSRTGVPTVNVPEVKFDQAEYKGASSSAFLLSWLRTVRMLTGFEIFMTVFTLFVVRIGTAWINGRDRPKRPSPAGPIRGVQEPDDVQTIPTRPTPIGVQRQSVAPRVVAQDVQAPKTDVLDTQSVGHGEVVPRAKPEPAVGHSLGHGAEPKLGRPNVQKIRFDMVAPGVWASPDKRTKSRYNVNRTRRGLGTKYLCRISKEELAQLRKAPPEWGRAFIKKKIETERQNDAKKRAAIEFLEAA
jgi:hypothetical protein